MKYLCKKECGWGTFSAKKGDVLTASDLVSGGEPLPEDVVKVLVRIGCLVPVTE